MCFQNGLPFCFREVWVITACMDLIKATTSHYDGTAVAIDSEREFCRIQGDLYSLCRIKVSSDTSGNLILISLLYIVFLFYLRIYIFP